MAKAAQKPQELNINLIQEEESSGGGGELIHWVLTVGRYLVIITEIIALGTFALGIKLSADKNDLKQKVKAAQAEVDFKSKCDESDPEAFCEDRFRLVQDQIKQIRSLRENQFKQTEVLKEFLALLPKDVKLTSLTAETETISFSGSFPKSVNLNDLIISLSSSKKIVDLDIEELTSPTDVEPNFKFKASATIDESQFQVESEEELQ